MSSDPTNIIEDGTRTYTVIDDPLVPHTHYTTYFRTGHANEDSHARAETYLIAEVADYSGATKV